MKRGLSIFMLVFIAAGAFSLDATIYEEAGVVTYFSQYFSVGGSDLLDFQVVDDDISLSLDFYGNYSLNFQSPEWYVYGGDALDINISVPGDPDPAVIASDWLSIGFARYFMDPLPLSIQMNGGGNLGLTDIYDPTVSASLMVGIGLGRIVDVTPVARAIGVAEKLETDLTNEQIIGAAHIIGKSSEYRYLHRGKYDEEYYGALAAAMGMEDQVMTVRRALRDTISSYRRIGWSVVVSFLQGYQSGLLDLSLQGLDDPQVKLNADLAIPIGLSMQLLPSLWINTAVSEDFYVSGGVSVDYDIDHTTNWNSSVGVAAQGSYSTGYDPRFSYEFSAGTEVQLIEKLYLDVTARLGQDFYSQLLIDVNLSLQYYVL